MLKLMVRPKAAATTGAARKLNVQKLQEHTNHMNYRAIVQSDNVMGCRCNATVEGQEVYKFDTRMCYGADYHELYEEGVFPYFHGYPVNPNGQEYQGPIGNTEG